MPKGTKVDRTYQALKKKGMSKGEAARVAQSQTGQALMTGKPIRKKSRTKRPPKHFGDTFHMKGE